ncbi:BlaI/MecI/CopY family transcriptional regulator [Salinibacterium sp. NSLL150]|uniref:BlaI/MecI/CopY family transcriptional regulator n=1 Tax=unclassified Salinibacterium TaxID=2632331 RepID=UPI0018CDC2FC|nr:MULTISPECIES: BlaI/MecI/CopY family transcriptional regulator [unclassified Salinibacterium]MBH0097606.1 BlaI/MecI/CopY family transcriptional regulator [Salinibacterium sp. NSLL35]MBH0100361.1 BlaI/MecI/CopY family transcriptional regulator [Salinibacterium sp. NSLL150]MBH0103120.1 BlaI/MecI/CopY family transcriptional regulator [Salinibacterium sp. NSLL16]MBH0105881.1 BlaI/MecI/CopY family transcriptional regulator [Salinibacterium sp. NSLL17]MBH0110345.1 BlaI/MecI/CopY family transcripti
MNSLGELERSVMDLLWANSESLSAYDLQAALASPESSGRELAATTVLTVLSRLEKKNFVVRERDVRPHRYRAASVRAEHMADLMHEVLGGANDRTAVLERFVGQVTNEEAETLRRILAGR